MTDLANNTQQHAPARFSLDSWAVLIASALVALIVLGALPHISW